MRKPLFLLLFLNIAVSGYSDIIDVRDFGASPDDEEPDHLQIQNAIDAARLTNSSVYLPSGKVGFLMEGPITISNPAVLFGDGMESTAVVAAGDYSGDMIIIDSIESVTIRDMHLTRLQSNVRGKDKAAIRVTHSDTMNFSSRFERLFIVAHNVGINFDRAGAWVVRDCELEDNATTGIWVQNNYDPDKGDGSITGCFINSRAPAASGILHSSGGGLRITNNKFLNSYTHYKLNYLDERRTRILIISNNSFELGKIAIDLRNRHNSAYSNINISNNQFSIPPSSIGIRTVWSGFVEDGVIIGNIISGNPGATGIYLSKAADWTVSGNKIHSFSTGIKISYSSERVIAGINSFFSNEIDVNNGSKTSGKITIGAPNSAGTGFRELKIDNSYNELTE